MSDWESWISRVAEPAPSSGGEIGTKEQNDIADQIASEAKQDQRRAEGKKTAIHWLFLIGICVVSVVLLIIFVIRMAHLVLPAEWAWLEPAQIKSIDEILLHGALGGALTTALKQMLASHSPNSKSG